MNNKRKKLLKELKKRKEKFDGNVAKETDKAYTKFLKKLLEK